MKLSTALFAAVLMVSVGACGGREERPEDTGPINFERNSAFTGPNLRVFLTLEDGTPLTVNTADDAVKTSPGSTPLPGHQARDWVLVRDDENGTSIVYALVSWDPLDTPDYLLAGWWAQFPDQHYPDISFEDSIQYAIVDGPELEAPPELPVSGQVSYAGQAGGLYTYLPGSDWGEEEGKGFAEEWEGRIALTADFADGTIGGCVGCDGDLVTRRAHFGFFLGDELHDTRTTIADYELHLGRAPISPEGNISHPEVTVRHPAREITASQGHWGGSLSNRPDEDGNPRLVAGFVYTRFVEGDDSDGVFFGAFVAPSETYGDQTPRR